MPDRPPPGLAQEIEPGLRRVLAPNPSPMTYWGTNTFLLGRGRVTVIDPGPADPGHLSAILAALAPGETIEAILVTHAHLDHSPLARPLSRATGAPVLASGRATDGRSLVMQRLAAAGEAGGGEGLDLDFDCDRRLAGGDRLDLAGGISVWHTPGHLAGHLCFEWQGGLFSGDHVMGWSSSLVSPPDGDMGDFMASLARLAGRSWRRMWPAHGDAVTDPAARLASLTRHRQGREAAIRDRLARGPATPASLARDLYADTPASLMPAAIRNVFAHLVDLEQRKLVVATPALSPAAVFALREPAP
jgi:hydroxyacylglutathione hydrolase